MSVRLLSPQSLDRHSIYSERFGLHRFLTAKEIQAMSSEMILLPNSRNTESFRYKKYVALFVVILCFTTALSVIFWTGIYGFVLIFVEFCSVVWLRRNNSSPQRIFNSIHFYQLFLVYKNGMERNDSSDAVQCAYVFPKEFSIH